MTKETVPATISTDSSMINKIYQNVKTDIIQITEDKLKVILLQNKESFEKKNNFFLPMTLLITLVITLCTSTFKDSFFISKDVWSAVFLLSASIALVWLVIALIKRKKSLSIDELITKIKS